MAGRKHLSALCASVANHLTRITYTAVMKGGKGCAPGLKSTVTKFCGVPTPALSACARPNESMRPIHTPPRGSYTGPKLTQEGMEQAFIDSLATAAPVAPPAELLQALLHSANVTFSMPGGTAKTFPLSQLVPWPPNLPPRGGARLG
jgi:hypothetical protein